MGGAQHRQKAENHPKIRGKKCFEVKEKKNYIHISIGTRAGEQDQTEGWLSTLQEGGTNVPSWPGLPRGRRSRAGPFLRVSPSSLLKQSFAGLQVRVGFSRVVVFFFFFFSSFSSPHCLLRRGRFLAERL